MVSLEVLTLRAFDARYLSAIFLSILLRQSYTSIFISAVDIPSYAAFPTYDDIFSAAHSGEPTIRHDLTIFSCENLSYIPLFFMTHVCAFVGRAAIIRSSISISSFIGNTCIL